MKKTLSILLCLFFGLGLAACTPKFDWREIHGSNAPYVANFPAKPTSQSRSFDLAGSPVTMTMTAAQVDGVTFAIGSAEMPDAAKAQAALPQMKAAMVKNIHGSITVDKTSAQATSGNRLASASTMIDIEATGSQMQNGNKQALLLIARFVAQDKWVVQIVVVGKEKAVSRDAAEMFISSFKLGR